jgi:hypothetical protein
MRIPAAILLAASVALTPASFRAEENDQRPYNVLFIISDDLTSTALSCYVRNGRRTASARRSREIRTEKSRRSAETRLSSCRRTATIKRTRTAGRRPRPVSCSRPIAMNAFSLEPSASVPLIVCVPEKQPAVCDSPVELIDLYPTISALCGLEVPDRLQGRDISALLDDPAQQVREASFSVNGRGFLLREDRWAFIQYQEDGSGGVELFDMQRDPQQYTNLAPQEEYAPVVASFQDKLAEKLREIRDNDLPAK